MADRPEADAPDVVASEDAVVLEELVALPPERIDPLCFELERPACEYLREADLIDAFHSIAVDLTREAQAPRHPQEQSELALVTSELLALLGELDTAREYLDALTPTPIATTALQARQLAFCAQDLPAYARLVKGEIRSSASHESRRHSMALYSDVLRLVSQDEAESRRHLELSLRAFPSDPRFWLHRAASQLTDRSAAAKLRAPTIPESPQLSGAFRDLLALRSGVTGGDCSHPGGALMTARRSWQRRDFAQLLGAIEQLGSFAELTPSSQWLHACITAHHPQFRSTSHRMLDALIESGDKEAEVALLERRLHDSADKPSSVEVFSREFVAGLPVGDRLSLGLSVDADEHTIGLLCENAGESPQLNALVRAIRRCCELAPPPDDGSSASALRLLVGTQMANLADLSGLAELGQTDEHATPGLLAAALGRLRNSEPEDILPKVMRLLSCLDQQMPETLASALLELVPVLGDTERASLFVLGALLAQLGNAAETRVEALRQARLVDTELETTYRGLTEGSSESALAQALRALAGELEPSARRVLLELEARVAQGTLADDVQEFLPESLTACASLGPLISVLTATSPTGSYLGWSPLKLAADNADAHLLLGLLELLASRSPDGADVAVSVSKLDSGFADEDPLAHSLCMALGSELAPLDLESSKLDDRLRDWFRTREVSLHVPFDLDHVEPYFLSGLADRRQSPIIDDWLALYHGMHGGDAITFEKRLSACPPDAPVKMQVDALLDAALLDPSADPSLPSSEAARRVLELDPKDLASLRTVLRHAARSQSLHDCGHAAGKLAQQLDRHEWLAHLFLAIESAAYANDADSALEQAIHLDTLEEGGGPLPIWAHRKLLNHAMSRRDDIRVIEHLEVIWQACARANDTATLTLREAEAASRLEQWERVGELLERAADVCPEHLVVLSMRAEFLEARGELSLAAEAYDVLAQAACMPTHKVAAWIQAANLWDDPNSGANNSGRALLALERAVELDPAHEEATSKLRHAYRERGELDKLEQLLTRLLLRAEGTDGRAQLELDRASVLVDLGRVDEAQGGLERALSLVPEHEQALVLSARLHEDKGDFDGAEQQLLRLASLSTDDARQADAYQRLAALYETHLEQPARAEMAYREVLRRRPQDPVAAERLVQLLLRSDNPAGAVELLERLITEDAPPTVERDRNLELARIYDEQLKDRRRAEEILDRVRRRWPSDPAALNALATFYKNGKDKLAFDTLLDRSMNDARRALGSGRFDASFFEVIATVAGLRDEEDFAAVARATLHAVNGDASPLEGVGLAAANPEHSDPLAPEVLSLPLRAMLRKTGWALCAAHPIDMRALHASPLAQTHPELSQHLRDLARSFGLFEVDLHLSPALGAVCQPTASVPPTLVVGPAFAALEQGALRDALAIRALRILSSNAAALSNTAPVDLWPLLVGYLAAYLPDWLPPGLAPDKVKPIRERIAAALPKEFDPDLPQLAAEVAASIGNRASQLGVAVQQWGSRTALLALGDPGAVLGAIASASGQLERLTSNASERQKWIVRNPEARDLTIFSVSDAYVSARAKAHTAH